MSELPHAVLSEHFEGRMWGRRLRSAVFLTYQFDPAFFEQQVLPVFLDVPVSHAEAIRLIQLEDALRSLPGEIAVYYDPSALSGDGSAKLDVRRIPIRHSTGVFHPKNVFLLLENQKPDETGQRAQMLVVASLSANLTRAGWWENVEACHVEEIAEGSSSRLRYDIIKFLTRLLKKAKVEGEQRAMAEILAFLRKKVQPRLQKSASGQLYPHFFAGDETETLPNFLSRVAGNLVDGAYLEVISPFFDDAPSSQPLEKLIELFHPKEVRVFLPRSNADEALCREDLYGAVCKLPSTHWGRLPNEMLHLSNHGETGERTVHAKVYRFFTQNPKREICFVGSANLTRAAHQSGGNVETGFLVDYIPARRPEFWLEKEPSDPSKFQHRPKDEPSAASGRTRLNLVYHWDRGGAEAYWDDKTDLTAPLRLTARDTKIGIISQLPTRKWTRLPEEFSRRTAELLTETSLFLVHGEVADPVQLLVQEEGMSHKPSLLLHLSAEDILRYWALLSPAQRTAFLEARTPETALIGLGADLVARVRAGESSETLFDRFAGTFHAFGCLERAVCDALKAGNEKEATYRLFGKKYDSLGSLLDRIAPNQVGVDDVNRYVILLCARQLSCEIKNKYRDYWKAHDADVRAQKTQFEKLGAIREHLVAQNPGEFGRFLDWFEPRFLQRAEPEQEPQP